MSEVAPDIPSSAGAAPSPRSAPEHVAVAPGRSIAWRRVAGQAALMWLGTRVALGMLTAAAFIFTTSGPYVNGGGSTGYASITPSLLVRAWLRWDVANYLGIALHGYATPADAAFFPLYPLLTGALTALVGAGHVLAVALVVSNLGALAGFVALALLAAREAEAAQAEDRAARALRMLAIFPFAFLLAAPAADGLFFGLALWALFLLRRGEWGWATLCVFLATLTRLEGVILALPLLYEYASRRGRPRDLRGVLEAAGAAVAAPLALAVYALYLAQRFGEPFAFLQRVSPYWNYTTPPLWAHLPNPTSGVLVLPGWGYGPLLSAASLAIFVGGAALTLWTLRRLPRSLALYLAGLLVVAVSALIFAPDSFRSAGVYFVAAAPLFLLLGRWTARRPGLDSLLVACGLLLQAAIALVWLAGLPPA